MKNSVHFTSLFTYKAHVHHYHIYYLIELNKGRAKKI